MDEQMTQQLTATAERLANVAETLDRVLEKLDAQQEAMNMKVDRIVAAVEDRTEISAENETARELRGRLTELEKANGLLKAQAARMQEKLCLRGQAVCWQRNAAREKRWILRLWTRHFKDLALSRGLL